jgi:hypothetical protein
MGKKSKKQQEEYMQQNDGATIIGEWRENA